MTGILNVSSEIPPYRIQGLAGWAAGGIFIETARLHFSDDLGRPVDVFCQRQYPLQNANGAAILHCVGGGQTVNPADLDFWNVDGYAAASFDWQIGAGMSGSSEMTTRFPAGVVAQHEATETLENAVMPIAILCGRVALAWLAHTPGVDPERLGVCGISWGGYLTWLLAAYDERVRVIVPAFGCGGTFAKGRSQSGHGAAVREAWASSWEPQNLAERVRIPVCFLSATNDFFGYPEDAEALLANLTGPVVRDYLPNADHSLSVGQSVLARAFVRHVLLDGPPLPECPRLEVPHRDAEIQSVWWTVSGRRSPHRCWQFGNPPVDGTPLAFRRIQMPDGMTISSPIGRIAGEEISDRALSGFAGLPGIGWRWETGNTQFHTNDAGLDRAQAGLWQLTPARPDTDEPVVVLFQVCPAWTESLARGEDIVLHWSAKPERAPEVALCFDAEDPIEISIAAAWSDGLLTISAKNHPAGPLNIDWAAVGRIRIQSSQARAPFLVG